MSWADDALKALEAVGRRRHVRALRPLGPTSVSWAGHAIQLFSGNDYLGLSAHPAVKEAMVRASESVGMGPRGSALICGYTEDHERLENTLARLKETEASLLFPTGYAANLGVLTALGSDDTTFFSDALNHASIIDGCRLARGKVSVYRHRDVAHLAELLASSQAPRKVVVTDAIFSMEGTLAPLEDIAALSRAHDAFLVTDEAHATLVFGDQGGGLVNLLGLSDQVDFQVGTLSKAVGALGGYVATSRANRELLLNTARSYIFSTALPIVVVAGAQAAIDLASSDPSFRNALWDRVGTLADGLDTLLHGPIASIVLGDERAAVDASVRLLEAGFHVSAIRPPTVPPGTSRLRIALSAAHSDADVHDLLAALRSCEVLG